MKTLIIFARAPFLGQVKTRLAKCRAIGKEKALALYRAFLEDTFILATRTCAQSIAVHFTPPGAEEDMRQILHGLMLGQREENRFSFVPQVEGAFQKKIATSFQKAGRLGGEDLVMIGADSPMIRPEVVDEAFDFIHECSGMALGPSGEGGLYLIGFERGTPIDFSNVFDSGSEMENMLTQAMAGNIPLQVLPETLDVDVEADMVGLVGLLRAAEYLRKSDKDLYIPERTLHAVNSMKLRVIRKGGETRGKRIAVDCG
ncbi:MAG: DUF2064 domain-containing protein [Nitrospinota bacterium]|nr:DUF2064 domain-containing protein [Nitrospinota bacterium]